MKFYEFQSIQDDYPEKAKVGDRFLTGSLIEQRQQKRKGDMITYYEIISINQNGNIEYMTMFDTLEDDYNE
jgi:hypothetical protein